MMRRQKTTGALLDPPLMTVRDVAKPTVTALSISAVVAEVGMSAIGPLLELLLAETVDGSVYSIGTARWLPTRDEGPADRG